MLLITDKKGGQSRIAELMRAAGACYLMPLHNVPTTPVPNSLVVCDVDLSNFGVAVLLKDALRLHRSRGTALIVITDGSYHRRVQAHALGATSVLKSDVAPAHFHGVLEANRQFLGSPAQRGARGAAMAMSDVFDAARSERAISSGARDKAVQAVSCTVEAGGLQQWIEAVWTQDDLTYQHCLLVAGLMTAFCASLHFGKKDSLAMTEAALLHDVGKSLVPYEVLHSPARLTGKALEMVREHPLKGYQLLKEKGVTSPLILDIVLHHHEFLNGAGYPERLSSRQISDPVRLTTICDIFAALIERRSYKAPLAADAAYSHLISMRDELDSDLVREFQSVADQCISAPVANVG